MRFTIIERGRHAPDQIRMALERLLDLPYAYIPQAYSPIM
jgi:hypothetical protein